MGIKKKKKEPQDEILEVDKETSSSEGKEELKEEIESLPLEKTSKLRTSFRIKKKDKSEKKEKKDKKEKKKSSSKWETDDERVRSNHCEFKVKYLGNVEVQESRGME